MRKTNPTTTITTNFYENSPFELHNWVIVNKCEGEVEYERVGIHWRGKDYSLVLDEDVPRLEVWDGWNMEKVFDLTEPSNSHYEKENEIDPPKSEEVNGSFVEGEEYTSLEDQLNDNKEYSNDVDTFFNEVFEDLIQEITDSDDWEKDKEI